MVRISGFHPENRSSILLWTTKKDADIAQLVRAGRLYRQGCGFKSRYRYKINARVAQLA